jgi:DNA-binding MarR family transcriptional regulator
VTQFSLLRTLSRTGPARMSDLASAALLDRTALARTLDPLVERGFVAIAAGRDARTREVSLTSQGAKALRTAERSWRGAQERVAQRLGAAKLEALIATLAEIEQLHPDSGDASAQAGPVRSTR